MVKILKVSASVMVLLFMIVVCWFWTSSRKEDAEGITDTDVGFGLMEVTYLLALAAIWV